jgi:glycosyltransferase involved in cell wall biosynthesis
LAVDHIRKFTQALDYEILIYDNGSTDGSVEWLEAQPDVTLYKGENNSMKHGQALDFLTRRAKFPICALLCSDAFPVSPEWVTPALYLDEEIYLAGIRRPGKKRMDVEYPCPSYMFGWTEWLKRHSFVDNWPKWDTGEKLAQECLDEGHKIKTWEYKHVNLDGFQPKPCDYNGWAWHTWWSGRKQTVKGIKGVEFEEGYHDYSINMLRERFNLDY